MVFTSQKEGLQVSSIKKISKALADVLCECPLFRSLSENQILEYLAHSKSKLYGYEKGEFIFDMETAPANLLILIRGKVDVGKIFLDGRRSVITRFEKPGEIFGEVLLFLNKDSYEHFGEAVAYTEVLMVPKEFVLSGSGINGEIHQKLTANMISILAQKAFFLNSRVRLLLCSSLRAKIAHLLINETNCNPEKALVISREDLAELLGAARPSVSRELMKMHDDGLIKVDGKNIFGIDFEALTDLL